MDVPFEFSINDPRLKKDFKGVTISGYKRIEVVNVFYNAIFNSELENACRWAVELHSTGLITNILDKIELLYFKNINIANPYFIFYYYMRKARLNRLLKHFPKNSVIFSRNNQEIRNLICELVSIACLSKKNIVFENKSLPKLGKDYNEPHVIRSRIISKNTHYIYRYLDDGDPPEVKLALNEIVNILRSFDCNFQKVSYWYLWLKKITTVKLKGRNKTDFSFKCKSYNVKGVGDDYKTEWVWALWKIILDTLVNSDEKVTKSVKKIYTEFKKGYNGYSNRAKHYQLLLSLYILTTSINWRVNVRQHDDMIIQACGNINYLYKDIEVSLAKELSYKQLELREMKVNEMLQSIRKKEKKRLEGIVLVQDTSTGTVVEHKIKKVDQEQIREEKNRKKCEAFQTIVPKITKQSVPQTPISDYFEGSEERIINLSEKREVPKYSKLSKLDLIF